MVGDAVTEHTVDATAEEIGAELSTDVAPTHVQSQNLFHTDDPVEVITRASRAAEALKGVITQQRLVSNIKGREHVRVEGWTTLGSMLGVVPVVTWTRPVEGGWEARVEARTLDGRTIGAAEAMCSRNEGRPWNERPDYALRSMAQTRATSKALRGPLGFVVTLAGYEATPAEEMPAEGTEGPSGRVSSSEPPSPKQLDYLKSLIAREKPNDNMKRAMLAKVGAHGVDPTQQGWSKALKRDQASQLIEILKGGVLPIGEPDLPADAGEFERPADANPDEFFEPEASER
jgi:hypothetical protein